MHIYMHIYYIYTPRAGLEPATAGLEVQRAIHCANEATPGQWSSGMILP